MWYFLVLRKQVLALIDNNLTSEVKSVDLKVLG